MILLEAISGNPAHPVQVRTGTENLPLTRENDSPKRGFLADPLEHLQKIRKHSIIECVVNPRTIEHHPDRGLTRSEALDSDRLQLYALMGTALWP